MTISVNSKKPNYIILKIIKLLSNLAPSISHLVRFDIISVISIFSAVPIGKLRNSTLEKEKNLVLKENTGNFEKKLKN